MPAKSKAQFRFMKAVEEGILKKKGLPPSKAKEFTKEITKKGWKKLKDKIS